MGHIQAGLISPTDHPFVKLAFEGAKRLVTHRESNQKEPITSEMINQLVLLYSSSNNLVHMRFLIIWLLGFTGFLRVSELAAIQIKDITFFYDYINITIPKSKTDQVREGHIVATHKQNIWLIMSSLLERQMFKGN